MNPAARLLLVDNYDSFTWNLAQYLQELGASLAVKRNDEISVDRALARGDDGIVISPGPGRPEGAGICLDLVRALGGRTPLLGVCLGHQALAAAMGAEVGQAQELMHGKPSKIYHDSRTLYEGLPNPFLAGRYHSLAVAEDSLPADLLVSAYTSDGEIMGLRHRSLPVEGVQFHPESVLTPEGQRLLRNFLDLEKGSSS